MGVWFECVFALFDPASLYQIVFSPCMPLCSLMGRKRQQNQVSDNPFAVKKAAKRTKVQRRKKNSVESSDKEFAAILNQVSLHHPPSESTGADCKELVTPKVMVKPEVVSRSAIIDITQRTKRTELS